MYAYDVSYLEDARDRLGEMFDFAINTYNMKPDEFWDDFAISSVARCLSVGDPKFIAGMSGRELFARMIFDSRQKWIDISAPYSMDRSREYWAGWALAYYQWYTNNTFAHIHRCGIELSEIIDIYILHEASDEKFVEVVNELINSKHEDNMLKRLRKYAGLTQKGLSDASSVPLRMIQLYEQGQNDISKAQTHTVLALAQVLGCEVRDLMPDFCHFLL